MASRSDLDLISVVKYEKYALRGVLVFFWEGHILYENLYHSRPMSGLCLLSPSTRPEIVTCSTSGCGEGPWPLPL